MKELILIKAIKERFEFDDKSNVWIDKYNLGSNILDPRITTQGIIEEICEMIKDASSGGKE